MAYSIQYPITKSADFTGVAIGYLMDEFSYIYNEFNTGLDLLGTPTAPTPVVDNNTTRIATTAFVVGQASTTSPVSVDSAAATAGVSLKYAREDHKHSMASMVVVPVGGIILWDGVASAVADITPGTWQICDGTNGTVAMSDKFPIGAGGGQAVRAVNSIYSHNHTSTVTPTNNAVTTGTTAAAISVGSHTLTIDEIPSHYHNILTSGNANPDPGRGVQRSQASDGYAEINADGWSYISTTGGGGGHTHTASSTAHSHTVTSNVQATATVSTANHWPPFVALYYIKRIA